MNPITLFLCAACVAAGLAAGQFVNLYLAPPFFILALLIALSVKVANAWQKFVILRVGKLHSVRGAGFFMIFPVLDSVAAIIDERIQTTAFNAEQALTKDTVPVNVDAIIFWHVHDAQKAALAIHRLSPGDRPRRADFVARDDRRIDARDPAVRPTRCRCASTRRDR